MGYDVSFHPISPEEMQEWYFTPLSWVQQGQEEKVLALAVQNGIEDFYAEKFWIPCGSVRGQSRMNCLTRATAFILR